MATRSYTIVSHYEAPDTDTPDDESVSNADELTDEAQEQERVWQTGPLYKSRHDSDVFVSHRAAHPPRFIPAVMSYDLQPEPNEKVSSKSRIPADVTPNLGSWYKAIRATSTAEPLTRSTPPQLPAAPTIQPKPVDSVPQASSSTHKASTSQSKKRKARSQDWFIQNALASSSKSRRHPTTNPSSSSSLADILARAPPPLPDSNEARYVPPLRTKLGPGNRGYALLAQRGWKEGEGLGAWRLPNVVSGSDTSTDLPSAAMPKAGVKTEYEETYQLAADEPSSPPVASTSAPTTPQVIDLTLDESDDSDEDIPANYIEHDSSAVDTRRISSLEGDTTLQPDPSRTVLLAPLKTYLKPDRLGIGAHLKSSSKKTGLSRDLPGVSATPPQPSLKRQPLTDTAQAMYDKREQQRRKREGEHRALMLRLKGGKRGTKGFAAVRKEEERRRKDLLAYMNS